MRQKIKKKAKYVVQILAVDLILCCIGFVCDLDVFKEGIAHAARPTKISWEDSQPRWDVSRYVLYMKEGNGSFEPILSMPLEGCSYNSTAPYPIKCETLIPYDRMVPGQSYTFMIRTVSPQEQISVDSDWISMALGEDVSSNRAPNSISSIIPFNYNVSGVTATGSGAAVTKTTYPDNTASFDLTYLPPTSTTMPHEGVMWSFAGIQPVDTANYQNVYAEMINMNHYAIVADILLRSQRSGIYWGYTAILPAMTYIGYNIPLRDFRLGFNENPSEKKRSDNSVIDEFTLSIPPNYLQVQQVSGVAESIRLQSIYFLQ